MAEPPYLMTKVLPAMRWIHGRASFRTSTFEAASVALLPVALLHSYSLDSLARRTGGPSRQDGLGYVR